MDDATPTRLIDNDRVRVTEWKFKPGAHTGWHRHEMDYVVVPVTHGQLHIKEPDGERTVLAKYLPQVGLRSQIVQLP